MTQTKPPIDRNAEIADVPMPTAENAAPSIFVPTKEIGALDVFEIALMYLLEITNSQHHFPPGTLRHIAMMPDRVAELSESARRFMVESESHRQVNAQPAAVPPAAPVGPVQ